MHVRFGLPFVLHLEKTVAWDLLQKEILEKMKYFLRPTVCIQVCSRMRVCPGQGRPLQGRLESDLCAELQREKLIWRDGGVRRFRTED